MELDKGDLSTLLVAVGATRDKEAFRRLFAHFAPRLKSFMLRRGANGGLAEDVVQEAMINVWRKAHMFDPAKASAATWVFTIGRNVHIDHVRRSSRPELDPDDPDLLPDAPPDASVGIAREQDAVRLRKVLAMLPEEQREILKLAFFEEKPHREIAAELDLPLGTVKSRIRLALGKLRAELGDPA
ncbi:MAG: sigma-70 family RNA polymerase sigma factor [Rhodospirillales bacterium]